ncbi:MAG: hypothetical protein LBI95_03255 [Holosporales bacterium]|jgi:hypothetical protein|nr:hypothetical protein [Holosporales bacterium]
MLRNSVKIAFCGLSIAIVAGCSSTQPLLLKSRSVHKFDNIKINAEPYSEYRIRRIVENTLPLYIERHDRYRINIELTERDLSAVYTEKQVTKEQLRIAAKIEIYDEQYNLIATMLTDAFSTYEVCDDLPFSVLASKKQAKDSVLTELANAIVLTISEVLKQHQIKNNNFKLIKDS